MMGDVYDKTAIKRLTDNMGFSSTQMMEKFIMDFHIYKLFSTKIEGVLRGGMCTSFYTNKNGAMRLSKDVDLFVKEPRETVERAIQHMVDESRYKAKPRTNFRDMDNLLQYDIKYETKMGINNEKDSIKLDIMHDTNIELPHKTIPRGFKIFTEETGYDIVALTRGGLLADKITSLAQGSIGYRDGTDGAASKQIFDISMLLDGANNNDILEAFSTYRTITQFKIKHHKDEFTCENILEHIGAFMERQLILTSGIELSGKQRKDADAFKSKYLQEEQSYEDVEIKARILKTWLFASCIKAIAEKRISKEDAVVAISKCVIDNRENPEIRKSILDKISNRFSHELLDIEPLQNLLLLEEILKIYGEDI